MPFDMFQQVDALRPGLLGKDRFAFAAGYCKVRADPFLRIGECLRPEELRLLLSSSVLLRRRKSDLQTKLPPKERKIVSVESVAAKRPQGEDAGETMSTRSLPGKPPFAVRYHESGLAKVHNAVAFALDLLKHLDASATTKEGFAQGEDASALPSPSATPLKETGGNGHTGGGGGGGRGKKAKGKIVLFAHHLQFMDQAAQLLLRNKVDHVRLDGSTTGPLRQRLIERFHSKDSVQAALVGVTACAIGVSLTCASDCVFLELPPDASWLRQAEARLHRPG